MLDLLVIAPHPDDAELGAAGMLLRAKSLGWRIGVLDLTSGEPTPRGTVETRQQETAKATELLQLDWRSNLDLPNRRLEPTLHARHLLAEVLREIRPRWLCAPYWEDAHPDHVAATQLIEAARFWSKLTKCDLAGAPHHPARIYYYYCVHLKLALQPAFVLDISDVWEQKLAAIACYESQFGEDPQAAQAVDPPAPSTLLRRLRDEAAYWGKTIGTEFGEPFASREPLGLSQIDGLL